MTGQAIGIMLYALLIIIEVFALVAISIVYFRTRRYPALRYFSLKARVSLVGCLILIGSFLAGTAGVLIPTLRLQLGIAALVGFLVGLTFYTTSWVVFALYIVGITNGVPHVVVPPLVPGEPSATIPLSNSGALSNPPAGAESGGENAEKIGGK